MRAVREPGSGGSHDAPEYRVVFVVVSAQWVAPGQQDQ
jgi:hypothetical protein